MPSAVFVNPQLLFFIQDDYVFNKPTVNVKLDICSPLLRIPIFILFYFNLIT